jgi:putative ABC transport system ATP-binding protein
VLKLEGIQKRFRDSEVLVDVALEVATGECVALLGRSGSGKSTLLKIIAGLEHADSGTVEFNGVLLSALDEHARTAHRRRHIGQVFQFFELFEGLSVWENLVLPLKLNKMPIERERLDGLLDRVGLLALKNRFPDSLSGGEQQRLGVLRALVHRPALLLADEPTGNLDESSARTTLTLLFALAREQKSTLIVVTHAREVLDYTDRAFELTRGTIACCSP